MVVNCAINTLIDGMLAIYIRELYKRCSSTISNRDTFSGVFPTMTTMGPRRSSRLSPAASVSVDKTSVPAPTKSSRAVASSSAGTRRDHGIAPNRLDAIGPQHVGTTVERASRQIEGDPLACPSRQIDFPLVPPVGIGMAQRLGENFRTVPVDFDAHHELYARAPDALLCYESRG